MTHRHRTGGLLAATVLLAGCGASHPGATAATPSMAGMSVSEGQGTAATSSPGGRPPETALMVCSEDISSKVVQVLQLPTPPHTVSTWADSVYTCTYHLPMGPMVLSVQVVATKAAAGAAFDVDRTRLGSTEPLAGLGERAVRSPTGVAVVLKDSEVLTVDATALPAVFGSNDQRRTDLAVEIASDVLGCWTGDE
jgi:hypothetical protein